MYLDGYKVTEESLKNALENMIELTSKIETTVLEHHLLRDENWRSFVEPVFETAPNKL